MGDNVRNAMNGARLRSARLFLGYCLQDAAEQCGVTEVVYGEWERGVTSFELSQASSLIDGEARGRLSLRKLEELREHPGFEVLLKALQDEVPLWETLADNPDDKRPADAMRDLVVVLRGVM